MENETQEITKNPYEISFILKEENAENLRSVLENEGGIILEELPMTKIRFAYEMNKEMQGFLGVIRFQTEPENVQGISNAIRLKGGLIRFLIRRKEDSEGSVIPSPRGIRKRKPRKSEESLSNEALEKKIEEILQ